MEADTQVVSVTVVTRVAATRRGVSVAIVTKAAATRRGVSVAIVAKAAATRRGVRVAIYIHKTSHRCHNRPHLVGLGGFQSSQYRC